MAATTTATAEPGTLTREQCLYLAKLAEQAERYDEMVNYMNNLVTGAGELTVEERNVLSVAYKNLVGSKRAAWRIVSSIEQKEESRRNDDHAHLVKAYRSKIESELSELCSSLLKLLDSHLLPSATSGESRVFYLKMKGDYYRYLAEFMGGDDRKKAAEDSMLAYKAAQVRFQFDLADFGFNSGNIWLLEAIEFLIDVPSAEIERVASSGLLSMHNLRFLKKIYMMYFMNHAAQKSK